MTKIERVAKAIYDEANKQDYVSIYRFHDGDTTLDGRFDLDAFARAAIEALRVTDPDPWQDPVIEAVQTEVDIWPEDKPRPSPNFVTFISREEAAATWNAGIDAALKDA
jgi:hypothetical protein